MPPLSSEENHIVPLENVVVKKKHLKLGLLISFVLLVTSGTFLFWYVSNLSEPPATFPINTPIEIMPGTSISEITKQLEAAAVIKSNLLLYAVIMSRYEPENVKASTYYFTEPKDVFAIAEALVRGDFNSSLMSFTHIEGERASRIAKNAEAQLTNFSATTFMEAASIYEGKLFPETYRIPKTFSEAELLKLMLETYEKNVAPLRSRFSAVNLTEEEVIILASIIEREANSVESMKMVSGILQNRLKIGMGLQVDASMEYVLDKPLKELTAADLKKDSPYNTYLNRGLPPTAIGNPGLDAIMSVLEPAPSDYMFYITGNDGNFYYAKNFDEHRRNVAKYLR